MGDHFFGLFSGVVSEATCKRINRALAEAGLDAHICLYRDPAQGPRGWLVGPNRGAPFDQALAREAIAVLEAAGLWTEDGPAPRRVRGRLIRREGA